MRDWRLPRRHDVKPEHRKGINCYVCIRQGVRREPVTSVSMTEFGPDGEVCGTRTRYYCEEHKEVKTA
jgi:hypothetical protein